MKYKYRISGDDAAIFRVEELPTGRLRFFHSMLLKALLILYASEYIWCRKG